MEIPLSEPQRRSAEYRSYAARSAEAASESSLAQLRAKHESAADAWNKLADEEESRENTRERRAQMDAARQEDAAREEEASREARDASELLSASSMTEPSVEDTVDEGRD
ncbi:MAG: hypothetical protein U1C74_17250 [Phenylobacterium sp.]|nr:hypothetical protein [Phenylobacterium sp.]